MPSLALSVRQPWAWAIIHAGKDVENRTGRAISFMIPLAGRRAIHASQTLLRKDYEAAREFMRSIGVTCPAPADLPRGGIIGSVEVIEAAKHSESPWFFGPRGLILRDPQPSAFIPVVGMLGYFTWKPAPASIVPAPARWMLPKGAAGDCEPDLFVSSSASAA